MIERIKFCVLCVYICLVKRFWTFCRMTDLNQLYAYVCVLDLGAGGGGNALPPDTHRRRRVFAGMKSLSVFGGRTARGESPSARSISLPESRILKLLHTHPPTLGHLSVNAIPIQQLAVSSLYVIVFHWLCHNKDIGTYRNKKMYPYVYKPKSCVWELSLFCPYVTAYSCSSCCGRLVTDIAEIIEGYLGYRQYCSLDLCKIINFSTEYSIKLSFKNSSVLLRTYFN